MRTHRSIAGRARRWTHVGASLIAATWLASPQALAQEQEDMSDVRIETVDLGSGLAMLVGRGGNIGVSTGADGVFLIDDQFAPLTPRIRAAVAALDPGPIRFVFNTHWHADHTGGNENLAGAGALIVAHDNVRKRMSTGQFILGIERRIPPAEPAALPVVTFDESVTFHLNGQTVHAFHVDPAHTDGDAVVHFSPADVIHTGDVYIAGMYPFIDLTSGGRVDGLIEAADRILAIAGPGTKIVPGHGPLSDREALAAWRAMLVDVRDRVQAAIDAGRTLDEILAGRPTADWDERYGHGFMKPEQFLRLVHASLVRRP